MWSAKSTRFSGGGGSSRIFPWSPQAIAIQWGGGVVAEFFSVLSKTKSRRDLTGGGVVGEERLRRAPPYDGPPRF